LDQLLNGLTDAQREAVMHVEGPLLILAGPGSGKTRVITYRIAHLIRERDVRPGNILAVTFTNKAATEMRERLERLLNIPLRGLWISTFHAACVRILRQHIERIGYKRQFVIYDETDRSSLIKTCMQDLRIDDKHYQPRAIIARISAHIPDKGQVMIRYYGLYSNAHRGKEKKRGQAASALLAALKATAKALTWCEPGSGRPRPPPGTFA
jgi:DNA helicase-2/ATP-dependent DNA helicase PcrA